MEILAIIVGPLIGVLLANYLTRKEFKNNIFKNLVINKASFPTDLAFVGYMNTAMLIFYKKKKIQMKWNEFSNHVNIDNSQMNKDQLNDWSNKLVDLTDNLLEEVGRSLGYKIKKYNFIKAIWSPKIYAQKHQINENLAAVLSGDKDIKISLVSNLSDEKQKDLQKFLNDIITGNKPITVKVIND